MTSMKIECETKEKHFIQRSTSDYIKGLRSLQN